MVADAAVDIENLMLPTESVSLRLQGEDLSSGDVPDGMLSRRSSRRDSRANTAGDPLAGQTLGSYRMQKPTALLLDRSTTPCGSKASVSSRVSTAAPSERTVPDSPLTPFSARCPLSSTPSLAQRRGLLTPLADRRGVGLTVDTTWTPVQRSSAPAGVEALNPFFPMPEKFPSATEADRNSDSSATLRRAAEEAHEEKPRSPCSSITGGSPVRTPQRRFAGDWSSTACFQVPCCDEPFAPTGGNATWSDLRLSFDTQAEVGDSAGAGTENQEVNPRQPESLKKCQAQAPKRRGWPTVPKMTPPWTTKTASGAKATPAPKPAARWLCVGLGRKVGSRQAAFAVDSDSD